MAGQGKIAVRSRGAPAPAFVLAMFAAVGVAIFVTYWRLPASDLYHVSGSGPLAAAGRVVSYLGYSPALAAIPVLLLALDRLRGRVERGLAVAALGLCVAGFFFLDQGNLDARPENAIAAAGVAIAVVLTFRTMRRPGRSVPSAWNRWDRLRLGLGLAMLAMAVPVLAAELGFSLDGVPVLGSIFETSVLRHNPGKVALHPAVHLGHHEGLDGFLLAWSALLLWRCLPTFSSRRLRGAFRGVLCALLCYGFAVGFGDFWLEQIAKRGWTSWTFDVLWPALTGSWAILVVAAAVLWAVTSRRLPRGHRLRLGSLVVLALAAAAWPAGASAGGSTDIRTVVVSRDSVSLLTFEIRFAGPVHFDSGTKLQVMLDTDRDPSTGIEGAEYALDYSATDGGKPEAALIQAIAGETFALPLALFEAGPRSATFQVLADAIDSPRVFDFWVFIEQDGDLVDNAPSHVLVSTHSQPWTYPKSGDAPSSGVYPTQTYEDISDGGFETANLPWKWILIGVAGIAGLGALLGFGGWTFERMRGRGETPPPPAPPPPAPSGNGSGAAPLVERHPGRPSPDLEEQLLQAHGLAMKHESTQALALVERVRTQAVATHDVPALEEAWSVAAEVYRGSTGRSQQRAGRLAFDCQRAVAPVSQGLQPAGESAGPPPSFPWGILERHDLARGLIQSFAFCAVCGLLGVVGAHTTQAFAAWVGVWGGYWLLFLPLQVVWWAQGRETFWRPIYPTALLLVVLVSLIGIPTLLIPSFRRWLFGNMKPGAPGTR